MTTTKSTPAEANFGTKSNPREIDGREESHRKMVENHDANATLNDERAARRQEQADTARQIDKDVDEGGINKTGVLI